MVSYDRVEGPLLLTNSGSLILHALVSWFQKSERVEVGFAIIFLDHQRAAGKTLGCAECQSDRLKNKGWEKCRHKFVLGILIWKNIEHIWE